MGGLQNRFPPKIEQFWNGWYECLNPDCEGVKEEGQGYNHADCIHHIISTVAHRYVPGKHNESVFNSAKLNNADCHIGKPMQNERMQKHLLNRVFEIVMRRVNRREYELDENDYDFLRVYKKFYNFLNT
ncbi:MAG: hypothetical protein WC472_01525 [Candidatus Paceibacterota bacterium]